MKAARNGTLLGAVSGLLIGVALARRVLLVAATEKLLRAFRDGLRRQRLEQLDRQARLR